MEAINKDEKLVEVTIISQEMVKPSSPTPSNLKNFELSCIDQIIPIFPPRLMPVILFYPASPETKPLDNTVLKASLSRALTKFYPLAGRVKQSTITCNDEGIPFFEAQVNCPLSTVMFSAPKSEILSKLLPPPESLGILENQPISEVINLSIQVNVFTCGGVALAWYDIHKIMDGISSANFFRHWAAFATQRDDDPNLVNPDFQITARTFPPIPNPEPLSFANTDQTIQEKCCVVFKSFRFSNTNLDKLQPKAASNQALNPTRFQTVAGFIWEQILASRTAASSSINDQKTALILSMDMRSRLTPPLPQGSMGNLFTALVVTADSRARMPDLAAEIKTAAGKKKDDIRGYSSARVNPMRENMGKLRGAFMEYKDRAYTISSWCKVGLSELDFGSGKPKWVIPTDGKNLNHFKNFVLVNDYTDSKGEGIEAWIFLEEKDMEILQSNADFLAYASPVF